MEGRDGADGVGVGVDGAFEAVGAGHFSDDLNSESVCFVGLKNEVGGKCVCLIYTQLLN